jgi:hypothetical protein
MTKKDYVKFADMIAERKAFIIAMTHDQFYIGYDSAIFDVQWFITDIFKSDNPSFDSDRFNQYIDNKVESILDSVQ